MGNPAVDMLSIVAANDVRVNDALATDRLHLAYALPAPQPSLGGKRAVYQGIAASMVGQHSAPTETPSS
jgi:hypothetical protein